MHVGEIKPNRLILENFLGLDFCGVLFVLVGGFLFALLFLWGVFGLVLFRVFGCFFFGLEEYISSDWRDDKWRGQPVEEDNLLPGAGMDLDKNKNGIFTLF